MIAKCLCSVQKSFFGITFVEKNTFWEAQNTFKLMDKRAKTSGYGQGVLSNLTISPDYPGCPYCRNNTFFLCGNCKTLNCQGSAILNPDGKIYVTCGSCGPVGFLEGPIEKLDAHQDI